MQNILVTHRDENTAWFFQYGFAYFHGKLLIYYSLNLIYVSTDKHKNRAKNYDQTNCLFIPNAELRFKCLNAQSLITPTLHTRLKKGLTLLLACLTFLGMLKTLNSRGKK